MSRLRLAAACVAVLASSPARAEWREASTDHFLIYADAGERWLTGFADRLERAASVIDRMQRPRGEPLSKANRVVIYAVSGSDAVQKICGRCGSIAGFYVPRLGHSVAYTARTTSSGEWDLSSDKVLFHEYTHHVVLSGNQVALPKWYNEGLAEFLSTIRINPDGSVDIGLAAKHRAYNLLNAGMKIEQLIDSVGGADSLSQDIFYGRAWALTHMLMFDKSRAGQIDAYLTALSKGVPNLQAATQAFGDLSALQKQMNTYVRGRMPATRIQTDKIAIGRVTLRELTPGEAALMPVRLRSDRGVNRQQATEIVADARKRAAPFASDPGAQIALAEAEYDARNDVEAEAAADRVLAARPADIEALLYKGRVAVRRAIAQRSRDAKVWDAARRWFVRANGVDNDAAEPLMLYYQSFAAAGQAPSANASQGLYRALELSGQDPGVRIAAARQYVIDNRLADARRTLLPLAFDPHVPANANRFAAVVAAIDAKKSIADILKLGVPQQRIDADEAAPDTPPAGSPPTP